MMPMDAHKIHGAGAGRADTGFSNLIWATRPTRYRLRPDSSMTLEYPKKVILFTEEKKALVPTARAWLGHSSI